MTITPAGNLGRRDRRELLRAKARYERHGSDDELRAMVRLQVRGMTRSEIARLDHDELVRLVTDCDQATLRDVQRDVAAASAAATTESDRRLMADARAAVADVAAKMEERRGTG